MTLAGSGAREDYPAITTPGETRREVQDHLSPAPPPPLAPDGEAGGEERGAKWSPGRGVLSGERSILQLERGILFQATLCKKKRSAMKVVCGASWHSKLGEPLDIREPTRLSITECGKVSTPRVPTGEDERRVRMPKGPRAMHKYLDHLLRMKGEMVHEFKCEWVVVTARAGYKAEGERCMDHLPVITAQQEVSYLAPITRILTPRGAVSTLNCSANFPLMIEDKRGRMIAANPAITLVEVTLSKHNKKLPV